MTGKASPTAPVSRDAAQIVRHHQPGPRGVDALGAQHQLGQPLVQGHRHDVGVRAGVGEAQLLEQRRVERLAGAPAAALGGVEDQVGGERLDARRQVRSRAGDLDLLHLVPAGAQPVGDGVDGLRGVELRLLLAVGESEVVGECDLHLVAGAAQADPHRIVTSTKVGTSPSTKKDAAAAAKRAGDLLARDSSDPRWDAHRRHPHPARTPPSPCRTTDRPCRARRRSGAAGAGPARSRAAPTARAGCDRPAPRRSVRPAAAAAPRSPSATAVTW